MSQMPFSRCDPSQLVFSDTFIGSYPDGGGSAELKGAAMTGSQGVAARHQLQSHGLGGKVSDAAGVVLGRAMTDSAMAVKDAAAEGSSGIMKSLGANLKDAAFSAGGDGLAAYNEGADSGISSFKSEIGLRGALFG